MRALLVLPVCLPYALLTAGGPHDRSRGRPRNVRIAVRPCVLRVLGPRARVRGGVAHYLTGPELWTRDAAATPVRGPAPLPIDLRVARPSRRRPEARRPSDSESEGTWCSIAVVRTHAISARVGLSLAGRNRRAVPSRIVRVPAIRMGGYQTTEEVRENEMRGSGAGFRRASIYSTIYMLRSSGKLPCHTQGL